MNCGDCPYCDGFTGFIEVPDKTPCYAIVECESCGKKIWYRLSKINPKSWTIEDFEKEFDIDEINRKIVSEIKRVADLVFDVLLKDNKEFFDRYFEALDDFIINGDPDSDVKPVGILNATKV